MDVGDELARKGKWIALVVQDTGQGKKVRLYLKYRPLALSLLGLLLGGYLASAVALTVWLDRLPYNRVTFTDVVLPWRWTSLNGLRGEGFAARGLGEIEDGNLQRGIFFLQRGLSLQPDNEAARMALGRIYAQGNYYEGVRRILRPQLDFRFSVEVAELLFAQAQRADDFTYLGETAEVLRKAQQPGSEEDLWLAEQQVALQLAQDRPADAWAIIREVGIPQFRAKTLVVRALIGLGDFDEALVVAQAVAPALAGLEPRGLKLEVLIRGAQKDEEATLALLERIKHHEGANSRSPWLFGIGVLATSDLDEPARRWIGDYLIRFAAQPGAVGELIAHLVHTGNLPLLRHAMRRSAEWMTLGPNQRVPFALLLINSGEWESLADEFADVLGPGGVDNPLRPGLDAVLAAIRPGNPPELLVAYLNRQRLQFGFYRAMAQGFAETERWDLVKLVTEAGLRAYSSSVTLQDLEAQAQAALADVVADTRAADAMAVAAGVIYTEEDAPRLRLELRRGVEAEHWDGVESLIRQIRRQRPAWLSQIQPTLDWAEAHAAAAGRDYDRLLVLAPAVLRRDPAMASWLTDQAETAIATGRRSSAIRLLEAVLAEEKFYHRARANLKALTAPPEEERSTEAAPGELSESPAN